VTVDSPTVNEGSPFVVFTVDGVEGQFVKLELGNTASTTDADATLGTDTGTALEYWNGTAWTPYTPGSLVQIPSDNDGTAGENANLLVRVAITNDTPADNGETFTLTATNTNGTPNATGGIATIKDDGTGVVYIADNSSTVGTDESAPTNGAAPTVTAPTTQVVSSANATNLPNDDRPLSVNSLTVNEGSPYAVFTVSGSTGQYTSLALTSGAATVGTDTGGGLQYYDGTNWVDYTAGDFVKIPAGGLLVRTAITNDTPADNGETFNLVATNVSGNAATGVGTIKDDGTGSLFSSTNTTGTPDEAGTLLERQAMMSR
jgi:hypothetical protein